MKTKLLAFILFLAPVLTYVIQNNTPVTIHFVKWEVIVPQALLLFSVLLTGIILGLLLCYSWKNKKANQQKKAEKKAKKLKRDEEKLKKKQAKQEKKVETKKDPETPTETVEKTPSETQSPE